MYDKIIFGFYNFIKNIYSIEQNSPILILIHIDQKINSLYEIIIFYHYMFNFFSNTFNTKNIKK